jgi:hypothetical protein
MAIYQMMEIVPPVWLFKKTGQARKGALFGQMNK